MTITIDPVTITTLVALILASLGGFVWFGKLSSRVDRLESDVGELKQGQKEILELLHKQERDMLELFHQHEKEILELLNQHIGYHQGLAAEGLPPSGQPS